VAKTDHTSTVERRVLFTAMKEFCKLIRSRLNHQMRRFRCTHLLWHCV